MRIQSRDNTIRLLVATCGLLAALLPGCQRPAEPSAAASSSASREVTFNRDVAPIIFGKCSRCHHPGEAAPFSLLTYEDVRRRATQIVEVTEKRLMPPWLPEPGAHEFAGDRHLSESELQTLKQWAAGGAPRGDDAELQLPPSFVAGWQAGTPDLVLESPAYTLAAHGSDVFRNFVVPIELEAPRWVRSIELRPENPRVTHHARLGVDSTRESDRRDAEDPEPGYAGMAWGQDPEGQLVIWAPGVITIPGTSAEAWRLNPKSCLVLHTHMQPSGKTEAVKFRIGVRFAGEPPTKHPAMLRVGSRDIDIPAGAAHHVVTDQYTLPIDVELHRVFPHAHSLCRELSLVAELPSGKRETLISIKKFDENWHDMYQYRKPVHLPRGTRLVATFAYDNTAANVRNRHNPPQRTAYGSNADDEMADVYLQVTASHADQRAVLMEDYKRYELQSQLVGFRKTLELHADDPWSQEGLAACYVGLGKPAEAVNILQQRLKTDRAVFPMTSLGMALLFGGDPPRGEEQLREAISVDNQYPLAWLGLGRTLVAQKKLEPAEAAFRRALELVPSLLDARLSLADLLIKSGRLDEAEKLCKTNLSDSPEMANVYLKLAEVSVKRNRYDAALEHFKTAQRLAPYTHPPKVLLAIYCFQNGDQETARKLLREAHAELPDHPVPTLYLGQMASRQQQLETARQYLEAAAQQPLPENWPDSHRQRFLVLLHSERFQLAQKLHDEQLARDAFSQWLLWDPQNPKLLQIQEQSRGKK
jgi:tetratricopeptide (TPR) repeat protein